MVQIRLFGGVGAATDEGEPVDIGSARSQAVLAVLALSPGSAVPVPRLVDLVYGDAPPKTAEKALQWHIARLRSGLGPGAIVRTGAAYRLDVEPEAVDVARFRRHLDGGDIDAALAEWTGTPLAGLDAPGLTATVAGLVEQWLSAVELALQRRVEIDPQAAVGPLTELTEYHPFREGLWALLMTALYRVGRQADALAAFRSARQYLVEQLGVEPGPRLRELESLILGHDERLRAGRTSAGWGTNRPTGTVTFGFVEADRPVAGAARLDALISSLVDDYGGYVFVAGGASFGAAFHRAEDAVAWADQLHRAVRREPWPGGVGLRVRIGLHTGETEERTKGYFGPAVHLAACIAAAGHGGQTLASSVTAALIDRPDLRDLGAFRFDSVVTEQRVFQLDDGDHPPLRTEGGRDGNLPRSPDRLIGRDAELEAIAAALAGAPVVTLLGPGGIGKTRLALAAAAAHPGSAWLVDLAQITSPAAVPRAVADALGVPERRGRTLTQSIIAVVRSRPALVVLDNCEHVIDGAAVVAHGIAESCPDARVLATSRERLGIGGELLLAVGPLDPAGPGSELFRERAAALDPTFDLSAYRAEVEGICRRLDGIPLAIELAAARTSSLSPADLLIRLDDRLRLLTGGRRSAAERHRTLRSAVQWSYDLLTAGERTVFQRLSIFAGPFDLAAAEAVAADPALDAVSVDDLLGGLVERSMLVAESGPFHRRFRMLETIRQFAAEQLRVSGPTDLTAGRHGRWCLNEVAQIHQLLTGPAEIEGVARLAELWPNLRAAVDRACVEHDPGLADALVRPIVTELPLRGRHEIGDWAERLIAMTAADDDAGPAFWRIWAAERYTQNGNHEAYKDLVGRQRATEHPFGRYADAYLSGDGETLRGCLPEAVAELRQQDDGYLAEFIEVMSAGLLLSIGRFGEVDALADRYRAQGPPTLQHWMLQTLGYSASFQDRHDQAEQFFEESTNIRVPDGTLSANRLIQARVMFRRGHKSRALQILRSYINDLFEADNVVAAGVVSIEFINMMATIDRLAEAATMLGYLEETNEFGALAARTLVAEAASKIAANTGQTLDPAKDSGRQLDDRRALAYMCEVLDELAPTP